MNRIPETAIGLIRREIAILDNIEDRLLGALTRLEAEKLSEITLRKDEHDALEREYVRWAKRLADDLGATLNAYSERFRSGGGIAPLNVSVSN